MADCKYRIERSNLHQVRKQASEHLCDLDARVSANTLAGYGGIYQSTNVALPDLGIGWVVMTADSAVIQNPVDVTQDFANNGLIFEASGVWQVSIAISMVFVLEQFGRQTVVQIYNATTDSGGRGVIVPIGRNQEGLWFSVSLLVEISDDQVGNLYQVRVGVVKTCRKSANNAERKRVACKQDSRIK